MRRFHADQVRAPAPAAAANTRRASRRLPRCGVAPSDLTPLALGLRCRPGNRSPQMRSNPMPVISRSWALPVARHAARPRRCACAARRSIAPAPDRLTGLMPVRWAGRALSLPVPLLVSWNAYAPFSVPLLDRDCAVDAAGALLDAAKAAGAHGLLLAEYRDRRTGLCRDPVCAGAARSDAEAHAQLSPRRARRAQGCRYRACAKRCRPRS